MTGGISYVLPLRWERDDDVEDLTRYLTWLGPRVDLVVVDGSPAHLAAGHRARWSGLGRVVPPDPDLGYLNGKVNGVITGVRRARHDRVVVADDDVRYDARSLAAVGRGLDDHDVVRPQNVFRPMPWHAWWDTGRSLVNRALGGDWPGTLGVRRARLLAAGGYDGDVLFENLEMVRTVVAAGGRERVALGIVVPRRPPTARRFLEQRVRQAYDDLAVPPRLVVFLGIVPAVAASRRPVRAALAVAGVSMLLAERGRRRAGGRAAFPPAAVLAAPLWVAERAVCAWLAVGCRMRGGVRYRDGRLRRAATPARRLRAAARRPGAPPPAR